MNFLDMDEFIERSTGKEIKELFAQGEEVFRDLESKSCELLSTLKKRSYIFWWRNSYKRRKYGEF